MRTHVYRLRGQLTRELAEAELRGRGRHDGLFLVREKTITANRIVFVLSMCYQGRCRHHLLERPRNGAWSIDSSEWLAPPLFRYIHPDSFPTLCLPTTQVRRKTTAPSTL